MREPKDDRISPTRTYPPNQSSVSEHAFTYAGTIPQSLQRKTRQTRNPTRLHASPCLITFIAFVHGLAGAENIAGLNSPERGALEDGYTLATIHRASEVRLLLEKASKLAQEWGCILVMFCGDLNSILQSPMYHFLASSKLDSQLHDRRNISGLVEYQSKCRGLRDQNEKASSLWASTPRSLVQRWSEEELRLATGSGGVTHLRHHLKLCSAYLGIPASCRTRDDCGEPQATSFHFKFMGTVDYIWHTEELIPLETLPVDFLKRTGGLPKMGKWPSCSRM